VLPPGLSTHPGNGSKLRNTESLTASNRLLSEYDPYEGQHVFSPIAVSNLPVHQPENDADDGGGGGGGAQRPSVVHVKPAGQANSGWPAEAQQTAPFGVQEAVPQQLEPLEQYATPSQQALPTGMHPFPQG
jgi:hypothetical protein